MAGYAYRNEACFKNVYFTGIVRDKQGRKMSKSLGNSPDPITLIEKYGADGVRMGMLLASPAGNDLPFDEALCEQGRNFSNKIWNAFRLVKGWTQDGNNTQPEAAKIAIQWFREVLDKAIIEMNDLFAKYRLSEAMMTVYKLFRDDFSSWFLELVKPEYQQPIDALTYQATLDYFDELLRLLHPFMPFISEELWQALLVRHEGDSIMIALAPVAKINVDEFTIGNRFDFARNVTQQVRNVRLQKNIPNKIPLQLQIKATNDNKQLDAVIHKMANVSDIQVVSDFDSGSATFLVGTTEYALITPQEGNEGNVQAERERIQNEIKYLEGFLESVLKKLNNQRFVQNAKPEIVQIEKQKLSDTQSKLVTLKSKLDQLN
jgi:valyl-tRNA synthetase